MNDPDLTDYKRPKGMDPGTKLLALFAGGIGALLVVVVGGWSLVGHHETGIPIVDAPAGPVRIKPIDPGGMQLSGVQNLTQSNGSAASGLAPGPETAQPQALQAQVDAARQADAAPAPAVAPAKAPAIQAAPPSDTASPAASASAEPAVAAPSEGKSATAPDAAAAPAGSDAEDQEPVAPTPAERPAAPPPQHGMAVQLAAVETQAAAQSEWARLSRRAPSLFAHRTPVIIPFSHGGKNFFRLRTAGFGTATEATSFCSHAKALGIACTLADF
ncbi:SPOR domain-containing protein [Lichenicola cladoniae]|uniref:SPOR domain-containing protein n=1 Tax=Lichenicola cladoniae TaxID=1484109 RepID=A0A6M8HPF7_9PROT|nr:SPOR domain-containing protein [Lichenicola cladoniae]NPD66412.1 SPOR domain-containing protein [Acetobacteraceae bacterium]QKE90349.1 SPOR domain-containing protein [Lichenicola cladoniae]